jgi:hypothetical protein
MSASEKLGKLSLETLRNEIEEAFGKKILSSRDCVQLSADVFNKTSFKINSNTLRRFFGLVKSVHLPSSTTSEILSKYCGYNSIHELVSLKNTSLPGATNNYRDSVLKCLVSIFEESPILEYEDKTLNCVVKQTIFFLNRHPELSNKLQRALAKTKNGQDYYYEQFINIDRLNSFYGEGLLYYLAEKKTMEAQVFGHSILCLKSWLIGNNSKLDEHYTALIKNQISKESHPFLIGRYYAARLFYANAHQLPVEDIIKEAQEIHGHIRLHRPRDKYHFFPCFEYLIIPALLLTGQNEEALYFVNSMKVEYNEPHPHIDDGFYQSLELLKALAYVKTGSSNEADKIFQNIVTSNFSFLTKKVDMILYYALMKHLHVNNGPTDTELKKLVLETGFKRLTPRFLTNEQKRTEHW